MRAGDLRVRLKLQSATTSVSRDSAGGRSETYSTYATVYAHPMGTEATEPTDGGAERATLQRTWQLRHRDDVTPQDRVVEEASTGSVWDITGVHDPTGRREELRLETRFVGV